MLLQNSPKRRSEAPGAESNYQLVHKWKSQAQGNEYKFQVLQATDIRHAQAIRSLW